MRLLRFLVYAARFIWWLVRPPRVAAAWEDEAVRRYQAYLEEARDP